ncbi:MAG TPA: hypothetical protein VMJ34_00355 [Bryobacteraceae bacterium]|nr:hypothetical protein [Bryobacteraceae bacterium]
MIVPTTHAVALLLTILAMIAWGSWATTYRMAGKWRFELYYYDVMLGFAVAAVIAVFTFGSLGNDLSFMDNFLIAGRMKMAEAILSGLIANLATILLVAAVSVAGLCVAFPISFGVALVADLLWNAWSGTQAHPVWWIPGAVLVLIAVVMDAMAWNTQAPHRKPVFVDAPPPARGVPKLAPRRPTGTKAILLSVFSGLLFGVFFPLAAETQTGDNGLGAYSLLFLIALGVFVSTFIYNIYFLNLPVQGPTLGMMEYFHGNKKQHALGLLGGAILCAGLAMFLATRNLPRTVTAGATGFALVQLAPVLAALWGLLVWKETADAGPGVKRLMLAVVLFYAIGVGLVGMG